MHAACRTIPTLFVVAAALATIPPSSAERIKGPVSETGEIGGAEFLIEIPEKWNGGLLMYAHGYTLASRESPFNQGMIEVGHSLGYAVAQSKYKHQGWAAKEGILDTETLRRHFVDTYGPTYPTIITGHSMGGAIAFDTIERYPEEYDGALPMCTSSESALHFFKQQAFDMRVLFDYYFPGLPGSAVDFPDGDRTIGTVGSKAKELVEADLEQAEKFYRMVGLPSVEAIYDVVGFWSEVLREMNIRGGGNPFDNLNTVYSGSEDDAALNREIARYKADPKAAEYMQRWVTVEGEISDPVLVLHTLIDELVPASSQANFARLTQLAGTSDLYVQMYVDRAGHCAFTEEEMVYALEQLTRWIKKGKRPKPGEITRGG